MLITFFDTAHFPSEHAPDASARLIRAANTECEPSNKDDRRFG